jgi:hypothetical protein
MKIYIFSVDLSQVEVTVKYIILLNLFLLNPYLTLSYAQTNSEVAEDAKAEGGEKPVVKPENIKPNITNEPKCYKKTDLKETTVKDLLKDLSDDEIMARLVLAESNSALAYSECNPARQLEPVTEGMAWVIANRYNSKERYSFPPGRNGFFAKNQFFSTINTQGSGIDILLCPSSLGPNWNSSWNVARGAVLKTKNVKNNPLNNVNFFTYGTGMSSKAMEKINGLRFRPDIKGLNHAKGRCVEFYDMIKQ